MKAIQNVVTLLGLMFFSGAVLALSSTAQLAKEAYFIIERNPLDTAGREEARSLIQRAIARDSQEPWVAVAQSRLTLIDGYKVGPRHSRKSYSGEAIYQARKQAEKAVENGPDQLMAHIQLAMVQIIQGELREAWEHLNTADSLDEYNFYPWYLRTVIGINKKDEDFANRGFMEIEKRISSHYQRRLLLQERIRLTRVTGDLQERERLYRAMIDLEPDYAYAWGNYGSFLFSQKRYQEAIPYLERAVSIKAYGLAVKQLEAARKKL